MKTPFPSDNSQLQNRLYRIGYQMRIFSKMIFIKLYETHAHVIFDVKYLNCHLNEQKKTKKLLLKTEKWKY